MAHRELPFNQLKNGLNRIVAIRKYRRIVNLRMANHH